MALVPTSSHGIPFPGRIADATSAFEINTGVFSFSGLGTTEGEVIVNEDESGDYVDIGSSLGVQINGAPGIALELKNGSTSCFKATSALVRVGVTAAPPDGDLAAGQASLWFDATNGAAKLMIKAKQNDGTVKTGSVNVIT